MSFVELNLMQNAGYSEAMELVDYLMHKATLFVTTDQPKDSAEIIKPVL